MQKFKVKYFCPNRRLLRRGYLVRLEAVPQWVGRDDENDCVERQEDQDGDVEEVPCTRWGEEAALVSHLRSDLERLERVNAEDDGCHQDRCTHPNGEVSGEPPVVLLVLELDRCAHKSPEEVEAEDWHPAEHQDPREVEGVADELAHRVRYGEEEFSGIVVNKIGNLDVVDDDQDGGCEDDGQNVRADDDALEVLKLRQRQVEEQSEHQEDDAHEAGDRQPEPKLPVHLDEVKVFAVAAVVPVGDVPFVVPPIFKYSYFRLLIPANEGRDVNLRRFVVAVDGSDKIFDAKTFGEDKLLCFVVDEKFSVRQKRDILIGSQRNSHFFRTDLGVEVLCKRCQTMPSEVFGNSSFWFHQQRSLMTWISEIPN